MAAWFRVSLHTGAGHAQGRVSCGESEPFEVRYGNGELSVDSHCEAGPGHIRGRGAD